MTTNKMPNFLVIGAHKAGTTSLYHYLNQHPQIFMSPQKEPHFFSFLDHPLDFNEPGFNPAKLGKISTITEYQSLFQNSETATAVGEASPSYLYVPQSPTKIFQHIPNVKIIAMLRNPTDRAYSNYLHCLARNPQEPFDDFMKALEAEEKRIQNNWSPLWHYKQKGFYYQQLIRYYQTFPKEQIQIHLYEDFQTNPQLLLQNIFQFLGVQPNFESNLRKKHNVSGIPKTKLWRIGLQKFKWANMLIPKKLKERIKNQALIKPTIPITAKEHLIAIYREDILQLQDLIHRDLSDWLTI